MIMPYRGTAPQIATDAFVAPNATIIGDVVIGARSSVWFGTVVRGDVHRIRIGCETNVQDSAILHVCFVPALRADFISQGKLAIPRQSRNLGDLR